MNRSTANKTVFCVVTTLFTFASAVCLVASPGKPLSAGLSSLSDIEIGFALFSGPTLPPARMDKDSTFAFSGPTLPPGPYDDNGGGTANPNSVGVPDEDDDDDPVEIASSPTLPPGPYDDNGNGAPDVQGQPPQGNDSDDEDNNNRENVSLVAGRQSYPRNGTSA